MPNDIEMRALVRAYPCLQRLDADALSRLQSLTGEVLASKQFLGAGGLVPDRADCLQVAVHAALPVVARGLDWLDGFQSFVLHRDEFAVEIDEYDDAGLVHHRRDLRAGEAWQGGPLVLSLADVAISGQGEGYHVVVHEIAHQIDALNGEPDGFPPLPEEIAAPEWTRVFTDAWQRLETLIESATPPWIDPYAAESPAEFFAVVCELHFDRPETLRRHEPALHALLRRFFAIDPAGRTVSPLH
ncbi:MAG: zinc-dependent peptidase [Wenzhouxiangellaceae bacterium]